MRYPLKRRLERLAGDRWARQGLRTLLRSFWIGISLLCLGLAGNLLLGWNINLNILITLVLGCVLVGALLLLRRRMSSPEVARRLDDRFELHEQLRTALEVNARSEQPEGVEQRLLEQAHITTGQIQRYIARRKKQPWVEIISLLAVALLSLGLFFLLNLTPPATLPSAEALPDLSNPNVQQQNQTDQGAQQQQDQQTGGQGQGMQQQQQAVQGSSIDQMSAAALADAMRDQGVTRPAAEALDQNNIAEAAQHLREMADQSGELSSETRRELAEELRDAAADIESRNPGLAEQVRDSAYGMQQSEQSSAEAFENLADAVEQLDGSGQQNEQQAQQNPQDSAQPQNQEGQPANGGVGNAPGEQREQPESSERLGVEGVPLELESNGEGDAPTEGDESTISAGGSGFEADQGGTPDDQTVQMDDDPLRIPADLRDVVQEYFSPTE